MSDPIATAHPSGTELEAYVLGMLEPQQHQLFEQHLLGCDACTDALAQEAQVEMQLQAAFGRNQAAKVIPLRASQRADNHRFGPTRSRRLGAAVFALATAAAIAAVVLRGPSRTDPQSELEMDLEAVAMMEQSELEAFAAPERIAACPDETRLSECVKVAAEVGLLVQYPLMVNHVPRYEAMNQAEEINFDADGEGALQ